MMLTLAFVVRTLSLRERVAEGRVRDLQDPQ